MSWTEERESDPLPPTEDLIAADLPYSDLEIHAEGGLGEVLRGHDPALHRTVAVKRLKERLADRPDARRRFLIEAEITARLEHPGVVPVYGLFHDGSARPVYAMRFIEGTTLGDAIRAYHENAGDAVAFRRLLGSFLNVCQTVAYAHSRGVLHRDLKPQNVMLGKFGETLVVDWGLAKSVGRPDELRVDSHDATLVPESGSGDGTAMGSVVGTPAYMSPEQAAGRWNVIDQRSDVYALGAVLYTLLTGRPAIARSDWPEMQQKIQQGDFPRPRQVSSKIPKPLESICLKAMALRPDDRYRTAEALGEDVEHWLADEPVAAHREPLHSRLRRWMRRHRMLVAVLSVVLVCALAASWLGLAILGHKNSQIVVERNTARTAADEAEAINAFLNDDLLGQADPDVNSREQKVTVESVLAKAAAAIDDNPRFADKPMVEASLRLTIGRTFFKLGNLREAERHVRRAVDLRKNNLPPEDGKTLLAQRELGWLLSEAGNTDEAGPLLKSTWEAMVRVLGPSDVQTLGAQGEYALLLRDVDRTAEAEELLKAKLTSAESRHGWDAEVTIESANDLGVVLTDLGKWAEAESLLRKALPSAQDALGRRQGGTLLLPILNNLSRALLFLERLDEAEKRAKEGIEASTKIKGSEHIHTVHLRNLLAEILIDRSSLDEGSKLAKRCLDERRKALPAKHPNIGRSLVLVGRALAEKGQYREAEASLVEAEDVFAKSTSPQPYLAEAKLWRAVCLYATGRAGEAAPLASDAWSVVKSHPMATRSHRLRAAEHLQKACTKSGDAATAEKWKAEAESMRAAAVPSATKN